MLASGACNVADRVPACRQACRPRSRRFTPIDYRNPDRLPEGGVLVVGASATGVQLADEIHRSGRPVTLAVGEHVRMPRTYRGRDILWWMDAAGVLDERYDEVDDLVRARGVPSPQLVGTPERSTLDLNALTDVGRRARRAARRRSATARRSSPDRSRNQCALADLKLDRLLDTFDEWAARQRPRRRPRAAAALRAHPRAASRRGSSLDLASGEIRSIVWATGLPSGLSAGSRCPVLDRKGRLRHDGGVVGAPGLYALGPAFLRRRKSSFIYGADDDAHDLAAHLAAHLAGVGAATRLASDRSELSAALR